MEQLDQVIGEGGALEALIEAKAAGKIGHIGLTAHSTAVFERALELDWVETIMFPYNIVEQQGAELIRKCAEKNIGFIDMKPCRWRNRRWYTCTSLCLFQSGCDCCDSRNGRDP